MKTESISYLTLKLTNRCNLSCAMCGQVFSPERNSREELDLEIINKILDAAPDVGHVYLFGGETLMYSEITELLKTLKRKKIVTSITTNGTLLDKYAEDIVKYSVKSIEISLDSHKKEILENIRGADVYEQIVKGIKKLAKMKEKYKSIYPIININCVILPYNYDELELLVNYFRRNLECIDSIFFQYPMITTEEQGMLQNQVTNNLFGIDSISWKWFNNPTQQFSTEEIRGLYNELELLKNDSLANFRRVSDCQELVSLLSPHYIKTDKVCECPFTALTILPNGDATFCTDFPDIILGNVYRENLNDIWQGTISQKFREYLNTEGSFPICARCFHIDEKLIKVKGGDWKYD